MNTLLIIRFIVFSGLLYLLYIAIFKRFSFFAGNRWLLLSIPMVSFVIPWVAPNFTSNISPTLRAFQLEEIILNNNITPSGETTNSINWLLLVYFIGMSIMGSLLIIGLIKAIRIKRNAVEKHENIHYSSSISSAYTFFKSIIIPLSLKEHKDIDTIIKHEQVHVRQWHGLDNLYFQIVTALAWFNPFIHLLAKELRQTHECLADEEAVEKTSREEYAHLLLSSAFGNELNFPLAAGTATPFFNSSLIKTRITMIYKSKTNRHFKWAYLALVPLLAAMTLYSCDKVAEEQTVTAQHEEKTAPESFMDVEQVPLFEGCDANLSNEDAKACFQQGLMQYIGSNFKYPKAASSLGLEGKVFVQFVIDRDASIKDVEVLRGLSFAEDNMEEKAAVDEAHEEISKLVASIPLTTPAYKDGKKVAMSFVIPINMKLK